jgi:hypothetical protein
LSKNKKKALAYFGGISNMTGMAMGKHSNLFFVSIFLQMNYNDKNSAAVV